MILYRPDGEQMGPEDWSQIDNTLAVSLDGAHIEDTDGDTTDDRFLLVLNGHHEAVTFTLPKTARPWNIVLTTGEPDETPEIDEHRITLAERMLVLCHSS
jgi:isoamylase